MQIFSARNILRRPNSGEIGCAGCIWLAALILLWAGANWIASTQAYQTLIQPPTPTPSVAVPTGPAIPGLTPANLITVLEQHKLTCDPVSQTAVGSILLYSWDCLKNEATISLHVTFSSRSLQTVDNIDATITQTKSPSDALAATFLEDIAAAAVATFPEYQPIARSWVARALAKPTGQPEYLQTISVGSIPMQLSGPDTVRTLEIGTTK
jgi:hypothetical protein